MLVFARRHAIALAVAAAVAVPASAQLSGPVWGYQLDDSESLYGSYLAGRIARGQRDAAVAADYYRAALTRDPGNPTILQEAFQLKLASGQWADSLQLANKLLKVDAENRYAQFFVGVDAFKRKQYAAADAAFEKAGKGPVAELSATLARAWTQVARKRAKSALLLVDTLTRPQNAQYLAYYHRALIADATDQPALAAEAYAESFRRNARFVRLIEGYGRHLTRAGNPKAVADFLAPYMNGDQTHPLVAVIAEAGAAGRPLAPAVNSALDGLAEVFFGIGEALAGDGVLEDGQMFLQLALYARSDLDVAYYALGELHEQQKNFEAANTAYEVIPAGSALAGNATIRKAFNLNQLKRTDEARLMLEKLVASPSQSRAARYALANVLRANKQFAEAIPHLTAIIDGLPADRKKSDWVYFYARGICFERVKQWPAAEADLKQALELDPNQDQVLNYLGYSWVDQGLNIENGMALIQKAVQLKPNSGFIVDSLGWAYYQSKQYDQAVKYLERAVDLQPEDPILNDHLGDAYFRVGRILEAKYQWAQALAMKPEGEDEVRIRRKVESGTLADPATRAANAPEPASR